MSALQCSCQSLLPNIAALAAGNRPTIGEVLQIAYQTLDFWPVLKHCPDCLHRKSRQLHTIYQNVIVFLQLNSAALDGSSNNAKGDDAKQHQASHDESSLAAIEQCMSATELNTIPSVAFDRDLPRMMYGDHELDREHAIVLLRSVYLSTLKRLASVLFEMRRAVAAIDMELHNLISDTLCDVFAIAEPLQNKVNDFSEI